MKTLLFLTITFFLLQSCSFTSKPVEARVSAGAGYSKINGGSSWKPNIGGAGNIDLKIPISDKSSVIPGLGVSLQGSKYEDNYFGNPINGKVVLTYINLPVLYSYQFTNGIYVEAGVQPGLLVSAKDKYNGNSDDFKDAVKSFELGIPVGGGYRFNNGLGLGVRIIPGIMNLDDTGSETDRNLLGMFMVSYNFLKFNFRKH